MSVSQFAQSNTTQQPIAAERCSASTQEAQRFLRTGRKDLSHKLPRVIGRFHLWLSFVKFNMFFFIWRCPKHFSRIFPYKPSIFWVLPLMETPMCFFSDSGMQPLQISASKVPVVSSQAGRGESGGILMHHFSGLHHHVLHLAWYPHGPWGPWLGGGKITVL